MPGERFAMTFEVMRRNSSDWCEGQASISSIYPAPPAEWERERGRLFSQLTSPSSARLESLKSYAGARDYPFRPLSDRIPGMAIRLPTAEKLIIKRDRSAYRYETPNPPHIALFRSVAGVLEPNTLPHQISGI